MHNGNGNFIHFQFVYLVYHILADLLFFFFGEFRQGAVCTFAYCTDYLLYIKKLLAPVLFYDIDLPVRSELFAIIFIFFMVMFKIAAHFSLPFIR